LRKGTIRVTLDQVVNAMCLAIPGKVTDVYEQQGMRMAKVQFGGITREACLEYVPDTQVGQYVLVHVGFAISTVDEEEAKRTYELLEQMDQLEELNAPSIDESGAPAGAMGTSKEDKR
jgi:hydrogenase expression/formation protein HypC